MRKVSECFDELKLGMWVRVRDCKSSNLVEGVIGEITSNRFYVFQDKNYGDVGETYPYALGYKFGWRIYKSNVSTIEILSHYFKVGDKIKVVRTKSLFRGEIPFLGGGSKFQLGWTGVVTKVECYDTCEITWDEGIVTKMERAKIWMIAKIDERDKYEKDKNDLIIKVKTMPMVNWTYCNGFIKEGFIDKIYTDTATTIADTAATLTLETIEKAKNLLKGEGGKMNMDEVKTKFHIGDTVRCISFSDEDHGRGAGWCPGAEFKVTKITEIEEGDPIYWHAFESCGVYEDSLELVIKTEVKKGGSGMKDIVRKVFAKGNLEDGLIVDEEMSDVDLGNGFMAERLLSYKENKDAVLAEAKRRKKAKEDAAKKGCK